jgi:hypothetical protein
MATNPFSSAPSGTGGFRGISRQIATVMAGSNFLGGKGGVNARQASELSNQQHIQNVQRDVMNHVLGTSATEDAAKAAHGRKLSQNRQAHNLSEKSANAAHERGKADREDVVRHLGNLQPEGTIKGSVSIPGGGASYKAAPKAPGKGINSGPQFGGVGGDTSGQAAVNLE